MKFLLILLVPFLIFSQDNLLIGDVDCNGVINSEDASLILQFVTNVIDELPCQENMSGLTPEQLQEIINMMDEQLNLNYNIGGSNNYPIMISSISSETLTFGDALLYCTNLEENGYSDWFLANLDQLTYAIGGGCELPDERTINNLWTTSKAHGESYDIVILNEAIGDIGGMYSTYGSSTNQKCRCVRFGDGETSEGGSSSASSSSLMGLEQAISMIGPMYSSTNFPNFNTWDAEEGVSIYYADAFRFCAQLIYDGYDDWRLPTVTAMHSYVRNNPQEQFVIPDHDTAGWGSFWVSAMHNNPSSAIGSDSYLSYNVPTVHISGSNHETLPNQILFYGAMSTYGMINCFCVR